MIKWVHNNSTEENQRIYTDTKNLFIGSNEGNVPVNPKADTVAPLAETATNADVINKVNEIITKLKAAKLMK